MPAIFIIMTIIEEEKDNIYKTKLNHRKGFKFLFCFMFR